MDAEPVVPRNEVSDPPEHVGDDEHAAFRPPQRHLLPHRRFQRDDELERSDRLPGDGVQRHAEPVGDPPRVAVVPIEQLDDAGGPACLPNALLHSLRVDRIDHPHGAVRDERVRAALQELVRDDPAEAAVELVAEADRHERFHTAAYRLSARPAACTRADYAYAESARASSESPARKSSGYARSARQPPSCSTTRPHSCTRPRTRATVHGSSRPRRYERTAAG